ncbi:MAG: osmoprotectant ABC transporter substrate-binding protein [Synergistaceae bacterium]|nr:osmoprotectant ABC transporter substrate-binding protein [Synergistaceae bacterium]
MRRAIVAAALFVALIAIAVFLPGLGRSASGRGIVIAGGSWTERQILAEVTAQMIRHHIPAADVTVVDDLGSTTLIHYGMMGGDLNMSGAMYTGTSLTGELGLPMTTDPEEAMEIVVREYDRRFGRKWYPSWGFANTYAFMVSGELAEREGLRKVSDLARLAPGLRAGVDPSWMEREGDGYAAFTEKYGFSFGSIYPMEVALVYKAVSAGEIDVALGYSTDGRIATYGLGMLEDDLHFFPPYDASIVATHRVLEQWPELDAVLMRLVGTIDSAQMQRMNRDADEELVSPQTVARQFLEANHHFEEDHGDARKEDPR